MFSVRERTDTVFTLGGVTAGTLEGSVGDWDTPPVLLPSDGREGVVREGVGDCLRLGGWIGLALLNAELGEREGRTDFSKLFEDLRKRTQDKGKIPASLDEHFGIVVRLCFHPNTG